MSGGSGKIPLSSPCPRKGAGAFSAVHRVVEPEIIDQLPADHPDIRRSRWDLKWINLFMGNERWISHAIGAHPGALAQGAVEIGAGEGTLIRRIHKAYPRIPVSACDLAPRPADLPAPIQWTSGDVFDFLSHSRGGVLLANLFLHHFINPELERLRPLLGSFKVLCLNEPFRHPQTLLDARYLRPFIGRTTEHDMMVSIRAGFVPGELPKLLGLESSEWVIHEHTTWQGGLRLIAHRRA